MKQTIVYNPDETKNIRIDKFLSEQFPEYSRSALSKLFDLKLIKLNGEPIQAGFRLKPGATVEYDLGPLQAKPEVVDLPVLYEDDDIIVINKPAGVISHARGRFWQEASVASFIRDKISKELEGERGGIVHRLDRMTSGVMVCAKNEQTLKALQKAFSDRHVHKKYIALVSKIPKNDVFIIDAPISRDAKTPKKFQVDVIGKPAKTKVTIIHKSDDRALLLLEPETGRTHQLRVHLAYIGCPIIGDPLYGREKREISEHGNDLRLHAFKLDIPVNNERKEYSAPLPSYWNVTESETKALKEIDK